MPKDATTELFEILEKVGAKPTLFGQPVTAAEVKAYAAGRVDERLRLGHARRMEEQKTETASPKSESKPTEKTADRKTAAATVAASFRVMHDASSPVIQRTARELYESYIANSNGLSHDGKKCPAWEDLGNPVRSHWCAAAIQGLRSASKLSACDLEMETRAS